MVADDAILFFDRHLAKNGNLSFPTKIIMKRILEDTL